MELIYCVALFNYYCFKIPEFLENEHIDGSILSQQVPDNSSTPRKTSFRIVSELDLKKGNIKKKQLQPSNTKGTPPVQKKLFWKKRKQNIHKGNCNLCKKYSITHDFYMSFLM